MPYAETNPHARGYRAPETSREALPGKPETAYVRQRVRWALARYPDGLTSEEIAAFTGLPYATVQPRTTELANAGIAEDSGERRRNLSGKRAIVWRLVATT